MAGRFCLSSLPCVVAFALAQPPGPEGRGARVVQVGGHARFRAAVSRGGQTESIPPA